MLLNTPACLGFYATLLFGKRAIDAITSKRGNFVFRGHITEEAELTSFKAERVKEMFRELEGVFTFTCQVIEPNHYAHSQVRYLSNLTDAERADLKTQQELEKPSPMSARMSLKHGPTVDKIEGEEREFCWGTQPGIRCTTHGEEWKIVQDPRTRMTPNVIVLSAQVSARLQARCRSAEDILRCNLLLATTLLHELAHAVESGRPECREFGVAEAMFSDDKMPEVGHQLEMRVFGGFLSEQSGDSEWLQLSGPSNGYLRLYIVPLDFVARIQQQDFWDLISPSDLTNLSLLHLPRTIPLSANLYLRKVSKEEDEYWDEHPALTSA